MKKEDLPDDQVNIKISICNRCGGLVTSAVEHLMSRSSKNSFAKEAFEYDLQIKTISLLEFRKTEFNFCIEDPVDLKQTRKVLTEKSKS